MRSSWHLKCLPGCHKGPIQGRAGQAGRHQGHRTGELQRVPGETCCPEPPRAVPADKGPVRSDQTTLRRGKSPALPLPCPVLWNLPVGVTEEATSLCVVEILRDTEMRPQRGMGSTNFSLQVRRLHHQSDPGGEQALHPTEAELHFHVTYS